MKCQAARVAGADFAALRRFRKTYPPMPARRSRLAATCPGSGAAKESGDMLVRNIRLPLPSDVVCSKSQVPFGAPDPDAAVNWKSPAPPSKISVPQGRPSVLCPISSASRSRVPPLVAQLQPMKSLLVNVPLPLDAPLTVRVSEMTLLKSLEIPGFGGSSKVIVPNAVAVLPRDAPL